MTLSDTIGLDLGLAPDAAGLAEMARDVGARIVRVRFALGDRSAVDDGYLEQASATVAAMVAARLHVLAVIDGDLTVAPEGAGAFDAEAPEALARAWTDELVSNASRLAHRLGDRILAWEILPQPNGGPAPRISPARWSAMLAAVAAGLRGAGTAPIVAGALVSDEHDDGVEYLHEAYRAGRVAGAWPDGVPPFDAVAIRLDVLPDGGASEDDVAAVLSERTRRLWRVVENLEGSDTASRRGIYVSGVSWDARRCGEDVQGRNAWAALDTLTSDPVVRAVIWSALVDAAGGRGLFRGGDAGDDLRRPAWRAYKDFSLYAAQIGPVPSVLVPDLEPRPDAHTEAEAPETDAAPDEGAVPEPEVTPEAVPPPGAPAVPAVPAVPLVPAVATEAASDRAPETAVSPAAREREISFWIPDAATVLAEQGLAGSELEAALAAVVAKYGGYEWLPPGSYCVTVPVDPTTPAGPRVYTNQEMISALYRAGGGTWSVLDKSGLMLSELASRRDEPYTGPAIEELGPLSEAEIDAIQQALEGLEAGEGTP